MTFRQLLGILWRDSLITPRLIILDTKIYIVRRRIARAKARTDKLTSRLLGL